MAFDKRSVLRLDVEATPTGPVNLVQNPNGELGGWGWVTPVTFSAMNGDGTTLTYNTAIGMQSFSTEPMPITAGQYLNARWEQGGATPTPMVYRVRIDWRNASKAYLASSALSPWYDATTTATRFLAGVQAPSGAAFAELTFALYRTNEEEALIQPGQMRLRRVAAVKTSSALTSDFGYVAPATYVDVLGPTHSLSIKREELNVGTLTAEVLDASLDPSQVDLIRPGKRCRVMALSTGGTWTPLFTGKVSSGAAKYDPARTDAKRVRINLTALDATSALAQVSRPNGVATIAELPSVLEGAGVPWNVNGSGKQVPNTTSVTKNDNATALDQVAITRDSRLGYAWVDRRGVMTVWDRDSLPSNVIGTLSESVYSDLDLDYDTDRCINVVTIKHRRLNIANGATVEVSYGPFVNQASIDQWGPHSAEFTVHGLTDTTAAMQTYATSILTANATPAVRLNSVTLPIRTPADVTPGRALLDLYDLVQVKNANAGIDQQMRVTGIEHSITPERWTTRLDFTTTGNVAAPQQTPGLATGVAVSTSDTAWTPFTYQNGWTNYGGGWETGAYRRANGIVYLRGLLLGGTYTVGTVLFQLPPGFRLAGSTHTSVAFNGGHGLLNFFSDGNVAINNFNGASGGWLSLRNISFPVDG